MKRDKSKLVPIKKQVVDSRTGNTIERTYWVKPNKDTRKTKPKRIENQQSSNEENNVITLPFTRLVEKLSSHVTNRDAFLKKGIDITDNILGKLSDNVSSYMVAPFEGIDGVYEFETGRVILNDEVANQLVHVPILRELGNKGYRYIPDRKIGLSPSSTDDSEFYMFIDDILTPLHESLHAISFGSRHPGEVTINHAFDEGMTQLLTLALGHQFIRKLTNDFIDLSKVTVVDNPSKYFVAMSTNHPYLPYMHRLLSLGKYLGIKPRKYAELIGKYRFDDDTQYHNQVYSDFLLYLEFQGINVKDKDYDLAFLLGSQYGKDERSLSLSEALRRTGDIKKAVTMVSTDFGNRTEKVHRELSTRFKKFYKVFMDYDMKYFVEFINYFIEEYPTFDDIQNKLVTRRTRNAKRQRQSITRQGRFTDLHFG